MGNVFRLGVDTGGTFTDLCLMEESSGKVEVAKVSSTPSDPALAVINGLRKLIEERGLKADEVSFLIHGTTVATNALLEGKGAPTALVTTAGFEDILLIGRQNRPHIYNSWIRRPTPIVPRNLCYGVSERILYTGEISKPLDMSCVRRVAEDIKNRGIVSVAVCLIHSYTNPVHEQAIKAIMKEIHPAAFVTLSSEILSEFREYERTSTTCINAYVMPKVNAYVAHLDEMLKETGVASELYIMQSNGGVITAETAREASARTALSGPAGGALTGVYLSNLLSEPNVITIDMGGTSSDICLIESHQPHLTSEADIEGYPIKLPMIDINTIGAGGGSIAWIDPGGALRVGPVSAGAVPGPVCYGRGGTEPTVTDANAVLGRINPSYLLGGEMSIDRDRAAEVIEAKIAKPLGIDLLRAAEGIIAVVNANMIRGIRRVSVEKGFDPRDFALVPFGGAGPLHGVELAQALNMTRIVIPTHPGIASAFGMLSADVRHDYVQTFITVAHSADLDTVNSIYSGMEVQAARQLTGEGFTGEAVAFLRSADMRYLGQSYELSIPMAGGNIDLTAVESIIGQFHQSHERAYGYSRKGESVEFVNLRMVALGKLPETKIRPGKSNLNEPLRPIGSRPVYFAGKEHPTPIFNRDDLPMHRPVYGPAVVEQLDSTTVIPPGFRGEIEPMGNMLITEDSRGKG
jgi:N-methylhydantoinase A